MSLSIVPGIPIIGILYSSLKTEAPVKVPSPPIVIRASIPSDFNLLYAISLPPFEKKSFDLADLRMVPPLLIIFFTERAFIFLNSPSIRPW